MLPKSSRICVKYCVMIHCMQIKEGEEVISQWSLRHATVRTFLFLNSSQESYTNALQQFLTHQVTNLLLCMAPCTCWQQHNEDNNYVMWMHVRDLQWSTSWREVFLEGPGWNSMSCRLFKFMKTVLLKKHCKKMTNRTHNLNQTTKKTSRKIIQCKMNHQQRITRPSRREVIDVCAKKRD